MGLAIKWEDEWGKCLDKTFDPTNILHKLLPHYKDQSYHCLRYVDLYGNTVFNCLQMEALLEELERIKTIAETDVELSLIEKIACLARFCMEEPHTYIKFYGD